MSTEQEDVLRELVSLSDSLEPGSRELSIILAAGHGKRIKSEKSKMLHEIYGKSTVLRVSKAACEGLKSDNQIIVVGKKALEVAQAIGRRKHRVFVYQPEQRGTGDAVKKAIEHSALGSFAGDVYIFPGDMGLLTREAVEKFRNHFKKARCDMLVMTGHYEGDIKDNYYGRIITSKAHAGEVIEIKEYRDICAFKNEQPYCLSFRGGEEIFSREELLNIREFNTSVYAFKLEPLKKYINSITNDNVQGEIYMTDLIKIFNDNGLKVRTSRVENNSLVVAFNVKSVLKEMEETFRAAVYKQLKDIISIDDAEDFYIAEEAVERILSMDREYPSLDIRIGKGAWIGERVQLGRGTTIERNASLKGSIILGENVAIGENAILSTYPGQTMNIGSGSQIFRGNVIQGQISIGTNVRIETGVRITGSSAWPVSIGSNVLIKGMTYIFGSVIEDDLLVEHSILKNVYVSRVVRKNGEVQPIKYILPHPEGLDSISPLRGK